MASGAEPHEAAKLICSPDTEDPDGKAIYQALVGGKDFRGLLKAIKGKESESIRRGVLGYANAMYLNTGDSKAAMVCQVFASGNTYDTGLPGITVMCLMVQDNLQQSA